MVSITVGRDKRAINSRSAGWESQRVDCARYETIVIIRAVSCAALLPREHCRRSRMNSRGSETKNFPAWILDTLVRYSTRAKSFHSQHERCLFNMKIPPIPFSHKYEINANFRRERFSQKPAMLFAQIFWHNHPREIYFAFQQYISLLYILLINVSNSIT